MKYHNVRKLSAIPEHYYKAVNATTRTCLKYGSRRNSLLSHERSPRLYYYTDKSSCQNVYNVGPVLWVECSRIRRLLYLHTF